MFKIGDMVKLLENETEIGDIYKDTAYKVSDIHTNIDGDTYLYFRLDGRIRGGYHNWRFELAKKNNKEIY